MKTGNGKGGAGDDYQGSSMCSAADTGPSTKMANRGGADGRARGGQGWKEKNCFGLEHARFEASVEHSCKYLNACVCGSGDWGIIESRAVQ